MWSESQDTKKSPAREALFGDRKKETTEKGAFVSVCAHVLLPVRTAWADDVYLSISWTQLACRVAVDWIFSEGTMQLLLLGLLTQNKKVSIRTSSAGRVNIIVAQQNDKRDRNLPDIRLIYVLSFNLEKCWSVTDNSQNESWFLTYDMLKIK